METIILSAISWLAINLITWLSGKLWISKTYVSVWLAIFLWVVVYVIQILIDKYPMAREQIVWFASWSYAVSQTTYSLFKKRGIIWKNEQK